MKILGILAFLSVMVGCNATPTSNNQSNVIQPQFNAEVIEVSVERLEQYWLSKPVKPKMLNRRPSWLPKGEGSWTIMTIIDSTGTEVERTLISSKPEGIMTQAMVDQMPKTSYTPAASNQNKVPVKFYGTARVAPRRKL